MMRLPMLFMRGFAPLLSPLMLLMLFRAF